jgi:hypothetical protein
VNLLLREMVGKVAKTSGISEMAEEKQYRKETQKRENYEGRQDSQEENEKGGIRRGEPS